MIVNEDEFDRLQFVCDQRACAQQDAAAAREQLRQRLMSSPVALEDPVEKWRREADELERQREDARAERKQQEQREIREQRAHEIRLAKANQSTGVDWAAVLDSIADALSALDQRLADLEARAANNNNNNNNT
jgi:hypothetical protein